VSRSCKRQREREREVKEKENYMLFLLLLLLLFNGISVDKKQYEQENNVLIIHREKKYTYDYSCQIIMVG